MHRSRDKKHIVRRLAFLSLHHVLATQEPVSPSPRFVVVLRLTLPSITVRIIFAGRKIIESRVRRRETNEYLTRRTIALFRYD